MEFKIDTVEEMPAYIARRKNRSKYQPVYDAIEMQVIGKGETIRITCDSAEMVKSIREVATRFRKTKRGKAALNGNKLKVCGTTHTGDDNAGYVYIAMEVQQPPASRYPEQINHLLGNDYDA